MAASDHLSDDQFGYHVTSSRHRKSIEAEGLTTARSNDRKHVWYYPTREQAESHRSLFSGTRDMHGNPVTYDLYQVNLKGMRTSKDPHKIAAAAGGRVVKRDITPDRIKRIG